MAANCLEAPMCERGLLNLRVMTDKRESPHLSFPSHCHFNILITPQVFPLAQSLAALLEQSGHHSSFTFPGTKPSCVTVVCPYSVRSPAALELCLIGIGSFMDRGVPFQSFHPAVLWDLCKNNLSHFLESQLQNNFLTKMSTAEHLRRLWQKLKLQKMKIAG